MPCGGADLATRTNSAVSGDLDGLGKSKLLEWVNGEERGGADQARTIVGEDVERRCGGLRCVIRRRRRGSANICSGFAGRGSRIWGSMRAMARVYWRLLIAGFHRQSMYRL